MRCGQRRAVPAGRRTRFLLCVVLWLPCAICFPAPPQQLRLSLSYDDSGRPTGVRLEGLPGATLRWLADQQWSSEQWQQVLRVSVVPSDAGELPAVLGTYRIDGGAVVFTPRFPFAEGVRYQAVFDARQLPGWRGRGTARLQVQFALPRRPTEPQTVVTEVYPSSDVVPENLLKFYIHFSAPMSRGESYRHVHLLDESGEQVELPFLELGEELWDRTGTRFTLFFDPGRIKRGLKPREEVGPALVAGRRYVLWIDRQWPDARGLPLKEEFRKTFTVGPPDDRQPDPQAWQLQLPRAGTRQPLAIDFGEPLDHAMLQHAIVVIDPGGQLVDGKIAVSDHERRWSYTPQTAWPAGTYRLRIDTRLEDLAGNSIERPFEVDLFESVQRRVRQRAVERTFVITAD